MKSGKAGMKNRNYPSPPANPNLVDAGFGEVARRIAREVVRSGTAHGLQHQEYVGLRE